jgi:hypothetical protein
MVEAGALIRGDGWRFVGSDRVWLMVLRRWRVRVIAAAGPCWKGEIQLGPVLLGWQRGGAQC